jgi:hypothetical protein
LLFLRGTTRRQHNTSGGYKDRPESRLIIPLRHVPVFLVKCFGGICGIHSKRWVSPARKAVMATKATKTSKSSGKGVKATKPQDANKGEKGRKGGNGKIVAQNAPERDRKGNGSNPEDVYRAGAGYWSAVRAPRDLGVGKMHPLVKVIAAYRKAMGDGWKAFAVKKGKLSADERAAVNVAVTSRKDYGKPLIEAGYEVRWDGRAKEAGLFKIGK